MNITYERCTSCHGKKRYMGMGGMMTECRICNGVGFVKPKPKVEPKIITKRTRKPKNETQLTE